MAAPACELKPGHQWHSHADAISFLLTSRWLGHKDGGALAMKVYGHLRDSHSVNMAQKLTFSEKN